MLEGSKLTAGEIMTLEVISVLPHTSIRYVAKLLVEHHISGLPVLDEDQRLVGMVTENDLLQWSDELSGKQAWWLDMLAEGHGLASDFLDLVRVEGEKVRRVMTTDVSTITETMPVAEIAKLMVAKAIKRVPVLRDGKLVGIVSRADLVRALAQG
ncbi:MAG: putative signal-transduction protein with domain [Rhodospirillales bacterium]|nr:putative signal-transduction protein with domain [Rhodospirillales bacterium]